MTVVKSTVLVQMESYAIPAALIPNHIQIHKRHVAMKPLCSELVPLHRFQLKT